MSSLALGSFAEGMEAVYGMFDGDKNEELPRLLQCTMADVLLEEVQQSDTLFMSNTFLVSHRYDCEQAGPGLDLYTCIR